MGLFDEVLERQKNNQEQLKQLLAPTVSQEGFTDKFSYLLGLQRNKGLKIINNNAEEDVKIRLRLENVRAKLAKLDTAPLITNLKVLKPWHTIFEGRADPKEVHMYYQFRNHLYCNGIYEQLLLKSEDTKSNFRHIIKIGIYAWFEELVKTLPQYVKLHPLDKKIMDVVEKKTTWYLLPHNPLGILYYGTMPAAWSTDDLGLYPCGIVGDEMNVARITQQIADGFWNKFFLTGGQLLSAPFKLSGNMILQTLKALSLPASAAKSFQEFMVDSVIIPLGGSRGSVPTEVMEFASKAGGTVGTVAMVANLSVLLLLQTCRCITVVRRKYKQDNYKDFKQYESIENLMGDVEAAINMCSDYKRWSNDLMADYLRVQSKFDTIGTYLEEQNYVACMSAMNIEFETLVNGYISFLREFTEMVESAI